MLKKEGAEAWARVWCQSDNSRSINFFESNVAGKGEGRCGELVVTEIEEASLPAAEAAGHPIAGSATVRTAIFHALAVRRLSVVAPNFPRYPFPCFSVVRRLSVLGCRLVRVWS